jgi:hypothetical protein
MPRFFVEVPHQNTKGACNMAIKLFQETGSHFMTNADWGCEDGEHKAWFTVEIEDKESVLQIIPPMLRRGTKIVEVKKFTFQDMPELQDRHGT